MFRYLCVAIAALALLCLPGIEVFAQSTTVTTTAPSDTTINVGQLLAPWLQYLVTALVAAVVAVLGWLAALFQRKTGIEIDINRMTALQTAIENMAGRAVMELGDRLNGVTLDVRHPVIKQAVEGLFLAAPDAAKYFGLTPEQVAQKIIDKIGVLTASNATVTPTAAPATTPGV